MRPIRPNTRHRPLWHTVLLAILAIAFGGAGTVAALAYSGVIDSAKLAFWRNREVDHTGMIPVPVCARTIPAFTKVPQNFMIDPKTGQPMVHYYKSLADVPKGVITDPLKIRGRVTARDKAAPFFFVEDDFLPKGTRPGVAGGTPEGKLAITLDAGTLKGLVYDLREGDHVVLQASTSVDMPGAGRSNSGRLGNSVVATPDMLLLPKRSLVRTLVQDGVVVTPAHTRNKPVSSTSLTQGMTTRTVPVQEIVIAVDPHEVAPLNEAVDLKYEITCMARSGRPAPAPSPAAHPSGKRPKSENPGKDRVAMDITPGLNPMADIRFMEVMIGAQRQFVLFNGPGNSPVVAMQDDGSAKAGPGGATEESKQ